LFVVVWAVSLVVFGHRIYRLHELGDDIQGSMQARHDFMDRHSPMTAEDREALKTFEETQSYFEKQAEPYEDAPFQFYVFGLAAPPLAALAAWWVARGFRRTPT
jgi:hypothetical protein